MASYLLDTNVLVRYLTNDHGTHLEEITSLFAGAQKGTHALVIPVVVVAETAFVLQSVYKIGPDRIADAFRVFLSQRWMSVEERSSLLAMLPAFGEGVHFVDAYLAARTKAELVELFTFDKKLRKLVGSTR